MKSTFLKRLFSALLVVCLLINMQLITVFAEIAEEIENGVGGGTDIGTEVTTDTDTDTSAETVTPIVSTDVSTAEALETALSEGKENIRITADFEIDRTFFITYNVMIFTDEKHILKRAVDFAGDIFVVGEYSDGTACENVATLTLGNPQSEIEDLLIIDGNSENMTVTVVGTVIFVCSKGQADLYDNLTVTNNKKTGNERSAVEAHGLSYPDYVGGAVGITAKNSLMNIYGGKYTNNSGNTTGNSIYGGAFFNFATLNVYGGLFEGNTAARAGVFYNYRTLNLYNAEIKNNSGTKIGGAIYIPASTGAFTYIGLENDIVESKVTFTGNSSVSGGAIYNAGKLEIDNTVFSKNTASGAGGAIYGGGKYNKAEISNSVFSENTAGTNGGALFMETSTTDTENVNLNIYNTDFNGNTSTESGGAMYLNVGMIAYLKKANFSQNETGLASGANGGAIYCNGSKVEVNRSTFTENGGYSGGALYLGGSATMLMNEITAISNTAKNHGGFVYSLEATLTMYNSTLSSNTAGSGGVAYLYTLATSSFYNTTFKENASTADSGNGGALFIYTSETETIIHSCTFDKNTSKNFGGAMNISGVSDVKVYNTAGTGNSAKYGGFMYETKAGTVVLFSGVTVSGNTATNGPIIYGNTYNAVLNINKSNFTDLDVSGELDADYWAGAIVNKLTVNDISDTIPEYTEYEQPDFDTDVSNEVRTAKQLELAINAGFDTIKIIKDFEIDRTFYITRNVKIYTDKAHTIKRASDFAGDIFVVGEASDGTATEEKVTLTLGNPDSKEENLLIIDGNKDNLEVSVKGTVIFVCAKGQADLYDNLTIVNHKKSGNERTLNEVHGLSYPEYVGGAVGIIANGSSMNIYGGNYSFNSTNASGKCSYGGAFFNFGKLNVYGGTFEGNTSLRAGVFYNYRTLNLYNAEIKNNSAKLGGVIYAPASTGAFTYIGTENELVESKVNFVGNSAENGGVISNSGRLTISNTVFEKNTATELGGAIYGTGNYNNIKTADVSFIENSANLNGGAIYSTGESTTSDKEVYAQNTKFIGNTTNGNGGAVALANASRAYFYNAEFDKNTSSENGGAIYCDGGKVEAISSTFTSNSGYNCGAVALYSGAIGVMNDITATSNTASNFGGFIYVDNSSLDLYNSTVNNNSAIDGGAVYLVNSSAKLNNTVFEQNTATNNGGAVCILSNGKEVVIQKCTFNENKADNYGGAVYTADSSIVKMYETVANKNSATYGGVIYITTSGTDVTVNGLTVSDNTATIKGPDIYGNTTKATLNINKANYNGNDEDAISGNLTVNEIDSEIPEYADFGNELAGELKDAVEVSNANELEKALLENYNHIKVVADFEIDRTFFITENTTIFSTKPIKLTRAKDFGGDIFVVGEYKNGESVLLYGSNAKLILGNPASKTENLFTIDGNKDNMEVDVVGTAVFICNGAEADFYDNVTIANCYKVGNERTLKVDYDMAIADRVGGAAVIIASGNLNIYGGNYKNNIVKAEDTSLENGKVSTLGGAIYNYSNLRIYGGTFESNQGTRGGAIYNYRITKIYGGEFIKNYATVSGGMVFSANSAACHLIIGTAEETENPVLIKNNSSKSNGGAIYSQTFSAFVINGNTVFEGNKVTSGNGGAICVYGQFTARNVTFKKNTASYRGGAIYLSNSNGEAVTRFTNLENCKFIENQAVLGAGLSMYASSMDYKNGAIATVTNCEFTSNKAVKSKATSTVAFGGAIYTDRKASLTINNTTFDNNTADLEGGAIYTSREGKTKINDSLFTNNSALTETGLGGAIVVRSSNMDINKSDFIDNSATVNGGALYISYVDDSTTDSKVNVNDSLFASNTSGDLGGAVYVTKKDTESDKRILTVKNTNFEQNNALNQGGAVYVTDGASAFIKDTGFAHNTATAQGTALGGAISSNGGKVETDNTIFNKNISLNNGGAVALYNNAEVIMNNTTANANIASSNGGFIYNEGATLKLYNSNVARNSATDGGAMYLSVSATTDIYKTTFDSNKASNNGGALNICTGETQTQIFDSTFKNNTANAYGGAMNVCGGSKVKLYNTTATNNTGDCGGFMCETDLGTEVTIGGLTVSGNTANTFGSIIYGTQDAVLNIDKSKYTDSEVSELNDEYWQGAIVSGLTVNDTVVTVPAYDDYVSEKEPEAETPVKKEPVSVNDVFDLAKNSSDADINSTYAKFPRLDNSRNFMSRGTSTYPNINGNTVTVDTFVYNDSHTDNNCTVGQGLMIYQAMLYKQAHPDEEVYIDISSYRFSVQAAVNINRNSRYFGYMRSLVGKNYDEYGFVRLSYLLISAAKMGIHVTVIGQIDGYPISASNPNYYEYFSSQLNDPCDPDYVEDGVIGDYMNFQHCKWSLEEKGGTDMMHTKLCAVSHYLDMNGVEHKNAVWTSSSNLDGVRSSGANGNWKQQTASIVSDHEEIYRASHNYLQLIADYCEQEEVYEFQNIVNTRSTQQIDLILAGRGDEIPKDEQIVYIGSETDDVFELYFTPLGGGAVVWDEVHNPYCKYLRELYNSEDYILFTWNAAEYSGGFPLGQQIEKMIISAFHENRNPKNKIYGTMESFDATTFDDLEVGVDIGFKSFNQYDWGEVHNKDVQVSYVKDGQRYYVTLLNSLNLHSGSMSYQSNSILVVKEKTCAENSVFSTIARYTTKGDIAGHTYGEEQIIKPTETSDGSVYKVCEICGHKEEVGPIHHESEWIVDRKATETENGIRHTECLICGAIVKTEEILYSVDVSKLKGETFTSTKGEQITFSNSPKTIEAIIQVPTDMDDRAGTIIGNYDGSSKAQLNLEIYTNGRVRLYSKKGTKKVDCIFNTDIRSSEKTHIAVTVDGKTATLYVNGEAVETATLSRSIYASTENFVIGGDNRADNTQYFKGKIYAVNVFSDVRTSDEVKLDAILVNEDAQNLVLRKYFVSDKEVANTVSLVGKTFTKDDKVKIGKLESAPKTIEATIKVPYSVKDRAGVIVGNYDKSSKAQINLEIYTEGRVRLFYNNGTKKAECLFDTDIRSNETVNIAVTVSNTVAILYINGERVESHKLSVSYANATENFVIGGDNRANNAQYFKGTIYSVNMFSDVRTGDEIKSDSVLVTEDAEGLIYSANFVNTDNFNKAVLKGEEFNADKISYIGNLTKSPKTIEAIIKVPTNMEDRAGVIVGNYDGSNNKQFNLEVYSKGRIRIFANDGVNKVTGLFNTDIRSNDKTHIVVTVKDTLATLYVNGRKAETITLTSALPEVTNNFVIGGDNREGNAQYFKGTIYAVNLFSDVRTYAEIVKDYVLVENNTDALLYSGYFTDAVCKASNKGNGHNVSEWIVDKDKTETQNGIMHKECTLCKKVISTKEIFKTEANGIEYTNYAGLTLDAKGNAINLETLTDKPLTYEVAFKLPTSHTKRGGVLFGNYDGSDNDAINLEVYTDGRIRLYYKVDGTAYTKLFKTDVRSESVTHIAFTVDGLTAKLYVNGEYKETTTLKVALPEIYENYRIGCDNKPEDAYYFKGTIYSVNLFSDVRTDEEIKNDAILVTSDVDNLIYTANFPQK